MAVGLVRVTALEVVPRCDPHCLAVAEVQPHAWPSGDLAAVRVVH